MKKTPELKCSVCEEKVRFILPNGHHRWAQVHTPSNREHTLTTTNGDTYSLTCKEFGLSTHYQCEQKWVWTGVV